MWKRVKKAKDATSVDEAYAYALRLLEVRFRGEDELESRLKEKEFTDPTIASVLEKLKSLKYVDDGRLLEGLIREYREFGLYGPVYIKQKLLQRKLPKTQIEKALKEFYTPEDELSTARKFKQKHKIPSSIEDTKEKQRIMQRFLRRGFGLGVVFKVFNNLNDSD